MNKQDISTLEGTGHFKMGLTQKTCLSGHSKISGCVDISFFCIRYNGS
ncbi:hypothetical protein VCHA54P486_560003 [Vibrio chagasii]|nr:hypothetical protein VCHA54P486_560003 [Vibrio chagasii]